jgi:hypothetical protein
MLINFDEALKLHQFIIDAVRCLISIVLLFGIAYLTYRSIVFGPLSVIMRIGVFTGAWCWKLNGRKHHIPAIVSAKYTHVPGDIIVAQASEAYDWCEVIYVVWWKVKYKERFYGPCCLSMAHNVASQQFANGYGYLVRPVIWNTHDIK